MGEALSALVGLQHGFPPAGSAETADIFAALGSPDELRALRTGRPEDVPIELIDRVTNALIDQAVGPADQRRIERKLRDLTQESDQRDPAPFSPAASA